MYTKYELTQQKKPRLFNTGSQNFNSPYQEDQNNYSHDSQLEQGVSPMSTLRQNLLEDDKDEKIDLKRVNRAKFIFQGTENKNLEAQPQRKQAIKMNIFRESARQQQRQFHQQNHQYLRMFSVIATSAMSNDKFKINFIRQGSGAGHNKGQNKTSKSSQKFATVHLQLTTEVTSSLINYKFPIKEVYNMSPFKKQSIQFQSRQFVDPNFEFFVFQKCSSKIQQVKNNLKNVLEQGLNIQFKATVMRTVGNLNYFQYLDLVNRKDNIKSKAKDYPKQIMEIALQNEVFELNSDEEEFYTKTQIQIQEQETDERMVACQEFDLQQTAPSVYFQIAQQYTQYKQFRNIEFKFQKIYDKDININSDIRNIISSEKIYLIQLVKQIDLYIQLSGHCSDIRIMKQIYSQLRRKSQQFLKLLCGYTESKILKQYNIQNYHEKIMMFIEKSIKYNKQIQAPQASLLKQFPILKIWYQIPKVLFGYSREELHRKYYNLIKATLMYEEMINDMDLERQLSIKRPNVKYPQ